MLMTLAGKYKRNFRDNPGMFHSSKLKVNRLNSRNAAYLWDSFMIVNSHLGRFKFSIIKLITG